MIGLLGITAKRKSTKESNMSFIRQIEEAAAKKLQKIFLNSKKYADHAVTDLEKAEKALADAKVKAAAATETAHQAAIEAAQKAQQVATELMIEARAAEELMRHHKEILDK
jgi:phage gp46-like protein